MKIGELDQHCGECPLIDYCAEPFEELCLCTDSRLENVDTSTYKSIAKSIDGTNEEICESIVEKIETSKTPCNRMVFFYTRP